MGILQMDVPSRLNPDSQNRNFLRVVLAESNSTISEPIVAELSKDNHQIANCQNIQQIDRAMNGGEPDLVIIGNLDDASCLEVFRECSQKYQNLPIILLCHTLEVNQFFRDWVITKGGYDVMSGSPQKLTLLRQGLQKLMGQSQPPEPAQAIPEPLQVRATTPPPISKPAPQPVPNLSSPPPAKASPAIAKSAPAQDFPTQKAPVKAETTPASSAESKPQTLSDLTYQQTLVALNQISEISLRYFGGLVIGNYWKKAHKSLTNEHLWLESWSVDHNGVISYVSKDISQERLTERQLKILKLWVKGFIKECDRIIADYIELLQQSNPSEHVKQIIADL